MVSVFRCPDCGSELVVSVGESTIVPEFGGLYGHASERPYIAESLHRAPTSTARGGWRSYNSGGAAAAVADWSEVRFEAPARAASFQSDVQVPVLQAAVSGAFVGVGVCVAGIIGIASGVALPWWSPLAAGAVAAFAVAGLSWSNLLQDSRALLRKVESYVSDDKPVAPVAPAESLRVEVKEEGGRRMVYDNLGHLPELRLAFSALAGGRIMHLSRRSLQDVGIGADVARQILAELKGAGYLAYPNGDNSPGVLTSKGRALARGLA